MTSIEMYGVILVGLMTGCLLCLVSIMVCAQSRREKLGQIETHLFFIRLAVTRFENAQYDGLKERNKSEFK
jgi:hypothetical protein